MEEKQWWYFDFLTSDEEKAGKYVKIFGTHQEARELMFKTFGTKWNFQNDEEYFKRSFPSWMVCLTSMEVQDG